MDDFKNGVARYSVYLEELRLKVIFLVKIFAFSFLGGIFFTNPFVKFLMNYVNLDNVKIVTTSPFQFINLSMSVGFFVACLVTMPILIFKIYSFFKTGLLPSERNFFIFSLPFGLLLFVLGFSYGAFMLYYGIRVIAELNTGLGIANYWDISTFISQILVTSSLLGILFIFPIVIKFLISSQVIDVDFLKSKRKHAIVIIFTIVSLLPPTDGLSLILMAAPLIVIFELTILFNKKNGRIKKNKII